MAIPSRATSHGTFFVTSRTYNSRRLFQVTANAELFLETLQHYRREGRYKLHDFVVMPDHIHLMLTPQGLALERVMQLIKGGFSRRLPSNFPLWQRGFTDHRIRDRPDFLHHRAYIHDNPVRSRLCQLPEQYAYSSAYRNSDKPGLTLTTNSSERTTELPSSPTPPKPGESSKFHPRASDIQHT